MFAYWENAQWVFCKNGNGFNCIKSIFRWNPDITYEPNFAWLYGGSGTFECIPGFFGGADGLVTTYTKYKATTDYA